MSMRLTKGLAGATRLRPTTGLLPKLVPAINVAATRYQSTGAPVPVDPKTKAQSILDALPGSTLISKTAILSSIAGLSVAAISSELYVLNQETLVAVSLITTFYGIARMGGPAYTAWATAQVNRIRDILNSAREDHTRAVKDRIESVQQMGGVVEVTKALFEVSKETANLEAKTFELEQRTAFAAEAKSVLDSWVRYEAQVKQRQQKELAESLIAKVKKDLESPKVLNSILLQSVQDVERIFATRK
ncbi:hypothetical protein L873DRAFT_1830355 [Choiromyces venosus 120613-1]|uniref:ATP synthase subunit 4 n=1 Tax=Choiromyces venosus 120613-1 TaxID=1336337 RepID=A0A3N4JBG7_9PEZI|nr:hypothetical protein L873DRAFT_1830355 [Choiromyces venosus 120613-1]